jgi:hypothetical protein
LEILLPEPRAKRRRPIWGPLALVLLVPPLVFWGGVLAHQLRWGSARALIALPEAVQVAALLVCPAAAILVGLLTRLRAGKAGPQLAAWVAIVGGSVLTVLTLVATLGGS